MKRLAVLVAALVLGATAASALAGPPRVIGTTSSAIVNIVANDSGYTPSGIAVHAGARVTLRWTVKQSGFGHGLSGKLFAIKRIEAGKTGVVTFRAPKKPGRAITFAVGWPDNGQMKYTAKIAVVR